MPVGGKLSLKGENRVARASGAACFSHACANLVPLRSLSRSPLTLTLFLLSLSLSLSRTHCTGGTPWQEDKAKARAKKAKKKADKAAALAAATEAVAGEGGDAAATAAAVAKAAAAAAKAAAADAALKAALPKSYDEEFGLEAAARAAAVGANPALAQPGAVGPHGHKFRAGPAVLHGYAAPVAGATAEERLDMRAALKGDKFCR